MPEVSIVGAYMSQQDILPALRDIGPDVLMMDAQYQYTDTLRICQESAEALPSLKILIIGDTASPAVIRGWFKARASGYLLRRALASEVGPALAVVADGCQYISPRLYQTLLDTDKSTSTAKHYVTPTGITRRELQVLHLIVEECTTAEIAQQLFISEGTVETHRLHLIHKLGVRNTAGMVREAIFRGLYTKSISLS
ncbi:MAG: response regulator transcription factor [Bacteroidia bacterium]|nr:response regulator transcription factor [Bacteroidia bacterium]